MKVDEVANILNCVKTKYFGVFINIIVKMNVTLKD